MGVGSGRVVVTGIGLATGLGAGREATWAALRAGRSAARWLDVDVGDVAGVPFAGFPIDEPMPRDPTGEPVLDLLPLVAREAELDAGSPFLAYDPERIASLIGLSKGGVRSLGHLAASDPRRDPDSYARRWLEQAWPSVGAAQLARSIGARGPCLAPVAACATGLLAVIQGASLIRQGVCDIALAGAADASLEPFLLSAFRRMKALARCRPEDDPTRAVRPLDRGRTGFLVGEGAAVLVLERAERAEARGARAYAEVAGGAFGSDAFHLTDLDPDPADLAALIRHALGTSGTDPAEIDHINLHGTATRANDPVECQAIRAAFGECAGDIACTANKAQIGHLLGAAGAVELAITCLAIRDGIVPPTLNRADPDPPCNLETIAGSGQPRAIRAALKLSLGFGGHLAAAVMRSV